MAQMITFRLNTKPTYSERMTDARSELRKIIKDQLCKYPPLPLHLRTPSSLLPTRSMLTADLSHPTCRRDHQ